MQQHDSLLIEEAMVSVRQALSRIASLSKAWPGGRAGLTLCAMAERLYSERRQRDALFPSGLFGEPAWDLLLALFVAEEEGRALDVAAAFEAAHIKPSAGRRLIARLESIGLIHREADVADRRRRIVGLTEDARERLADYLTRLL